MQGPNPNPMSHLAQPSCADMPPATHSPRCGDCETTAFTRARATTVTPLRSQHSA